MGVKSGIGLLVLLIGVVLSARAEKVEFLLSSTVPAARGYVKVKKDSNKNYTIQVKVWNLAEVDRVKPSRKTYVLWMVNDKGEAENIGRLKSSTGFMSKSLKAVFSTTTTSKPSRFYITAEDDPAVDYSFAMEVLSTAKFQN